MSCSIEQIPEEIIAELYDSVLKFAHGAPQQDDVTAVLIKCSQVGVILPSPEPILKASAVAV
jgi:hypothetical protein